MARSDVIGVRSQVALVLLVLVVAGCTGPVDTPAQLPSSEECQTGLSPPLYERVESRDAEGGRMVTVWHLLDDGTLTIVTGWVMSDGTAQPLANPPYQGLDALSICRVLARHGILPGLNPTGNQSWNGWQGRAHPLDLAVIQSSLPGLAQQIEDVSPHECRSNPYKDTRLAFEVRRNGTQWRRDDLCHRYILVGQYTMDRLERAVRDDVEHPPRALPEMEQWHGPCPSPPSRWFAVTDDGNFALQGARLRDRAEAWGRLTNRYIFFEDGTVLGLAYLRASANDNRDWDVATHSEGEFQAPRGLFDAPAVALACGALSDVGQYGPGTNVTLLQVFRGRVADPAGLEKYLAEGWHNLTYQVRFCFVGGSFLRVNTTTMGDQTAQSCGTEGLAQLLQGMWSRADLDVADLGPFWAPYGALPRVQAQLTPRWT